MINPYNVVNILVDLVSNRLILNSTISTTQRDREVANMLFENVESILNSVCYSFENDFTLYFDNVAEVSDEMILSENDVNMKSSDNDDDDDDIDADGGGSDKSGYTTFPRVPFPRRHFGADVSANDIFEYEYTAHDAIAL